MGEPTPDQTASMRAEATACPQKADALGAFSSKAAFSGAEWAVIIPFYNEEDYLQATLESLSRQSLEGFRVILVDNASTDRSPQIAAAFQTAHPEMRIDILLEKDPGQALALKCGIEACDSAYVAICDADTIYPPHYLEKAASLLTGKTGTGAVAALAFGVSSESGTDHWRARAKGALVAGLLTRQCHAGGYGHVFKTAALKKAGGYDRALWPYCLKDHELMHRVSKLGRLRYDFDFWCLASDRRDDRKNVRWTLFERIMYHVTPHYFKDWFFYQFLKPRFEARGLSELKLRERNWESAKA